MLDRYHFILLIESFEEMIRKLNFSSKIMAHKNHERCISFKNDSSRVTRIVRESDCSPTAALFYVVKSYKGIEQKQNSDTNQRL